MDVTKMKDILKNEYGIESIDDFNEAVEKSSCIDLGIFLSPIKRRESSEEMCIVS